MDSIVHFEITCDDVSRAKDFYQSVFGWETEDMEKMNYVFATSVEVDEEGNFSKPGAINGGMMKRKEPFKSPVLVLDVKSIEESLEKIKTNGGEILVKKQSVGDMGFTAYFNDSEGNLLGLWESATSQ